MTAQDKAKELVESFNKATDHDHDYGKRCAIVAVNEILLVGLLMTQRTYWLNVRKEIQNYAS